MERTTEIMLETLEEAFNIVNGGTQAEGAGTQKIKYTDSGELEIKADGDIECVQTRESYSLPLRIDMTAKTDSTNIRLFYHLGEIVLNWEECPDELQVNDILLGIEYEYDGKGSIPIDEYVDISWVIGKRYMDIFVNGGLRHHEISYPYMNLLKNVPNRKVSAPVRIAAAWGSTITIKSLQITELE